MRNPRSQWQQKSDATASRVRRATLICFVLTVVLSASAFAQSVVAARGTGIPGKDQSHAPSHNGMLMKDLIGSSSGSSTGTKTITLTMPAGTQTGSLKAVLNGKDVSDRFSSTSCNDAACETGTLSSSDGLRPGKNVLYAVAKSDSGRMVSSRLLFAGDDTKAQTRIITPAVKGLKAQDTAPPTLPTASGFLPVAVAVSAGEGGYDNQNPWIKVGTQQTYPDPSTFQCASPGIYTVIVLDRATLQEKTAAPESSPGCFSDGKTLAQYFQTLNSEDLVIVGTNLNKTADKTLDTSRIGGTDYSTTASDNFPIEYVAIGVGGASPGQAFEFYNSTNSTPHSSFFKGMFQEDLNGNYNYTSSDALEYFVTPNDPKFNGYSTITISNPPEAQGSGITTNVLISPTYSRGGYWMVVFDRAQMYPPSSSCTLDTSYSIPHTAVYKYCGVIYTTAGGNDDDNGGQTSAYLRLASALNAVQPDQLAVLTTFGLPAPDKGDPFALAATNDGNGNYAYSGDNGFFTALLNIGGAPYATMYLGTYTPQGTVSTYTFIGSPGLGNSLSGQSVVSTTAFGQQEQTGYVHGLMTRDLHGYYRPSHTAQGTQGADSSDFTIGLAASQQPVEWPELGTLLDGSDSIPGQIAAYHYLSYYLITQYYIPDAAGSYLDDIHYYFTGSNNTYIDYHTIDPLTVQMPGLNSPPNTPYDGPNYRCSNVDSYGNCTWIDPVSGKSYVFDPNDWKAVRTQLHYELFDFVNVLQFMVNGSVNMKDVIAAGSANTALALIGAASSIEAGTLQPSPASPVKVSASNILEMVGSIVNIAATVATAGLVPPDLAQSVGTGVTIIGDLFSATGSAAGGLSTGAVASIPNPDYSFQTTIGELADSDLQGQFSAGFDTTLDSILGDWGKLSLIGPQITNTSNLAFYAPNQAAQNAAINQISLGTQRSLMLSLLPTKYQIHLWYLVPADTLGNGAFAPDAGSLHNKVGGGVYCNAFYNYTVAYGYAGFPSPDPTLQAPFYNFEGNLDGFVFSGPFTNKGKSNAGATIPDLVGQIFGNGPGALNLPQETLVEQNGPMRYPPVGDGSWINMAAGNPTGYGNNSICAYLQVGGESVPSGGAPPSIIPTTTTLTAPTTGVLGESITMQAVVTAASGPIPAGSVSFQDGDTNLGTAPLDATGKATYSASGLNLGTHSIAAYYITQGTDDSSVSSPSALTVYANAPSMALSLSGNSLTVSYGGTSSPVTLQVNSQSGLAGTLNFTCTGLPVGMTCNFKPAQASIDAGGSATTSLTISASAAPAEMPWFRGVGAILLFPLSLLCLWRIRRGAGRVQAFLCLLLLSAVSVGYLVGCGSDGTKSQPLQETGTKTVLVNATSGTLTQSVPIVLTIQ